MSNSLGKVGETMHKEQERSDRMWRIVRFSFFAFALGACTGGGSADGDAGQGGVADAARLDAAIADATVIDAAPVDASVADADVPVDATTNPATCNPATQAGCGSAEKCAQLVQSDIPFLAYTTCVPDGTVGVGNACTRGLAGSTGYDDCSAGLDCLAGVCTEICTIGPPDSCRSPDELFGDGNYCTLYENLFTSEIGLCVPGCDPVDDTVLAGAVTNTDCGAGNGCYLNATRGVAACAGTPGPAFSVTQNEDCFGPAAGGCYLNGCASGFIALLNDSPVNATGSVCARYCTPVVTHSSAQSGAEGLAGNCSAVSLTAVGGTNGAAGEHQCRFLQTFYSNTDQVPGAVGMCVPVLPVGGGTWSDCKILDWDGIKSAWNGAVNAGTDPNLAFESHCLIDPSDPTNTTVKDICLGLFRGCISNQEEEDALLDPVSPFLLPGSEPYISPARARLRALIESQQDGPGQRDRLVLDRKALGSPAPSGTERHL